MARVGALHQFVRLADFDLHARMMHHRRRHFLVHRGGNKSRHPGASGRPPSPKSAKSSAPRARDCRATTRRACRSRSYPPAFIHHPFRERMSDKLHAQFWRVLRVPILLERENHQHQIHVALDLFRAARVPRPQLRRDVVDDLDPALLHLRGEPQIESRKIHQHHRVRLPLLRLATRSRRFRGTSRNSSAPRPDPPPHAR